jgi:hypothetical protein
MVTAVSRKSKSIHNAASEVEFSYPAAISIKDVSSDPLMRSVSREKELFRPEMKSERTQKNVTVYVDLLAQIT